MTEQRTNFGKFLYSFRIRNGFENISNFLKSISLPMSDNYYRDVEAGRRSLSIEKAVELFRALPFNENDDDLEFFWHYFKDTLPEEIHNKLLVPRVDTSFKNVKEARETLEYDLKIHRKAAALARFENSHIITDSIANDLNSNIDLLPLIHYIYMVNEASENEVIDICDKNNIEKEFDRIDKFLINAGVAIEFLDGKKYKRNRPFFRVPRTEEGVKFKDNFLRLEVEKSLTKTRGPENFSENCTFDYSGIFALTKESRDKLSDRLCDFVSELNVSNEQLDEKTAFPFFVSIIVSARSEYDADPE